MKRKFISFVSLLACLMMSVCTLASCSFLNSSSSNSSSNSSSSSSSSSALTNQPLVIETTDTCLVIKVQKAEEDQTLLDVMQILKDAGKITYTLSGTMIIGINGTENPADFSSCWMLYTSDAEMANIEWGTYVYDGATYGSAVVGADALPVIDGGLYIWLYQSF